MKKALEMYFSALRSLPILLRIYVDNVTVFNSSPMQLRWSS